jgi:hypothetical protein
MKKSLLTIILLATLGLTGCIEGFYFEDHRQLELERAERKWNRAYIVDYDYEGFHDDPYGLVGRYMVRVRNGRVIDAYNIATGRGVPGAQLQKVPTIQDLFNEVYRAIVRNFDVLEVDYDPEFGFPSYLFLDVNRRASNDEYSIEITDMYIYFSQKYDQPLKISGSSR